MFSDVRDKRLYISGIVVRCTREEALHFWDCAINDGLLSRPAHANACTEVYTKTKRDECDTEHVI